MLTIQELGLQILQNNPQHFYIFGGTEYGIKCKYIDILDKLYGHRIEMVSMDKVIDLLDSIHLIPLQPAVYIVRYDEDFVKNISEEYADTIKNLKFDGTIVCLYESAKHIKKLNKFLPEYTASIDAVDNKFVSKYLQEDFPDLNPNYIGLSIMASANYYQAGRICACINAVDKDVLDSQSAPDILNTFGYSNISTDDQIKNCVASKSFRLLIGCLENYTGDYDYIIYDILSTLIELDKVKTSNYSQSYVRQYADLWKPEDIYNMFAQTYKVLKDSRTYSSTDMKNYIIYLFALLKYSTIPSVSALN